MKSVLYDLTPSLSCDGKKFEIYFIDKTFWDNNKIKDFYASPELEETINILSSEFDSAERVGRNRIQINGPKSHIIRKLAICKDSGVEFICSSDIAKYRQYVE